MSASRSPEAALAMAVSKAGGQSALARAIGCTQGAIWHMLKAGRMSHAYVLKAESATGISRHDLRPDIYPLPERRALRPDQETAVDLEPAR